jgi:hypothetical protein
LAEAYGEQQREAAGQGEEPGPPRVTPALLAYLKDRLGKEPKAPRAMSGVSSSLDQLIELGQQQARYVGRYEVIQHLEFLLAEQERQAQEANL